MFLTEQWRKLKTIPQTGGVVVQNSNRCHSFDPHLQADVVMLISQNKAMFHNCYALHFADLHLSHLSHMSWQWPLLPIHTCPSPWTLGTHYESDLLFKPVGAGSAQILCEVTFKVAFWERAAWSVLMSWLKFDSLRQQIWQLSAETSFSHTGIPLWGRA